MRRGGNTVVKSLRTARGARAPGRARPTDPSLAREGRAGRVRFVAACLVAFSLLIVRRLYVLQLSGDTSWSSRATNLHVRHRVLRAERGPVYDRRDNLLAVSVPAEAIYVNPRLVKHPETAVAAAAKALRQKPEVVRRIVTSPKSFVYLERHARPAVAARLRALRIEGFGFEPAPRRRYPYDHAAARVLGVTGRDGRGVAGVELARDTLLRGEERRVTVERVSERRELQAPGDTTERFELPRGQAVRLTLDAEVQLIVEEELEAGRLAARASASVGVLMDADTGDVLAMGQTPTVDFNRRTKLAPGALRNVAVENVYEPGSVVKPVVAAAALDAGLVDPREFIDCEKGSFKYGRHVIHDTHGGSGVIPFFDVIVRSSNIGISKVADRLGKERVYRLLRDFGFGTRTDSDLPSESAGILRPVSSWSVVDLATHSFGQGMAATPLQVTQAMATLVSGGVFRRARVFDDGRPRPGVRVTSPESAEMVKEMMYGVVARGTGTKAAVPGVRVGGKTGTAQKVNPNGRGYLEGVHVSSFVGFVDATAIGIPDRLTLLVVMDDPKVKPAYYGGDVAAPVFRRIMQRVLRLYATRRDFAPGNVTVFRPEVRYG